MRKSIFFVISGCIFMMACDRNEAGEKSVSMKNNFSIDRVAKGEELFKMHCISCHTLRYIEMQPEFPRKTWEKITDKMIKSFGAPIPDSASVLIVDYLMSVKGLKE